MSPSTKKAVLISMYDYYDIRVKYIRELLIKEGYEVQYYIASFNHYKKIQNKECRAEATMLKTISYSHNVSFSRLLSCLIFTIQVIKEIRKFKPELVYSIIPPNTLSFGLWKWKKHYKYRLILDIIDSWPESFSVHNRILYFFLRPLLTIWKKLRDVSIVHADIIIGVSNKALSVFPCCSCTKKLLYPMPCRYGEINLDYYEDNNTLSFCYVGGINKLLNIERTVSILGKLNCLKKVKLHVIGSGEQKDRFLHELDSKNIIVIDHGEIYEWEKKYLIYSQCSFGINIPNEGAKVTMSLKGAEYLCASLPMINEAGGDTEQLIRVYKAGINSLKLSDTEVVDILSNLSNKDIAEMKKNAHLLYKEQFESKISRDLIFN